MALELPYANHSADLVYDTQELRRKKRMSDHHDKELSLK